MPGSSDLPTDPKGCNVKAGFDCSLAQYKESPSSPYTSCFPRFSVLRLHSSEPPSRTLRSTNPPCFILHLGIDTSPPSTSRPLALTSPSILYPSLFQHVATSSRSLPSSSHPPFIL